MVGVQQRHGHGEETSFYLLCLLANGVEIATPANSRITRVERTRYGVRISQATDHPRAAYTLRGSHKASQELPAWCRCATRSTTIKSRTTHVERSLRGLRQPIHGLYQEANGYIGPFPGHTYSSNFV